MKTLRLVPFTRRDAIAETLRRNFPYVSDATLSEYIHARELFELSPTPHTLDRLITAHHLIASSIPTIELEP